jgi:hypothetical protein
LLRHSLICWDVHAQNLTNEKVVVGKVKNEASSFKFSSQ